MGLFVYNTDFFENSTRVFYKIAEGYLAGGGGTLVKEIRIPPSSRYFPTVLVCNVVSRLEFNLPVRLGSEPNLSSRTMRL